MSEVFISHAEEDASIALGVALELEKAGYRTWAYEVDSVPGPSYLVQTGDAVERAAVVVLIISPTSLGSHQCTREVVRGLETGKPFVPLLREVTHVEFQNRQPEWRSAVGAATSIQVPPDGVESIIPRIIAGLEALGIDVGERQPAERLNRINEVLAQYTNSTTKVRDDVPADASPKLAPSEKPASPPPTAQRKPLWMAVALVALAAAAIGVWWWVDMTGKPRGIVVDPQALVGDMNAGDELDISDFQDKLLVLHDLKGHYVAIMPYWDRDDEEHYFFYGDATRMAAQRVHGGGRSGEESFNYSMWDPRFRHAGFVFRDDVYRIQCAEQDVILANVDKSEAAAILASRFTKPIWKHHAYALARDEAGDYFYADKSLHGDTYRLFIGPKGALKQYPVTQAIVDSGGVILHTGGATLAIELKAAEIEKMTWANGGEKTSLTPLDVWANRAFIYAEMGLYPKNLGTACDNV